MHAQNPKERRYNDSLTLISRMINGNVFLCIDEGFSLDSAKNSSFIATEYLDNIRFGSLSFAMLLLLSTSQRIHLLNKRAPRVQQRQIEQLIYNKIDRIFLAVAFNSSSQTLVSHDFIDFSNHNRSNIQIKLGVVIIEAVDVLNEI